eukprot:gene36296-19441_t
MPTHGVLVFCPSKAQCASRDELLRHRAEEKLDLLRELKAVSATLDPVLA